MDIQIKKLTPELIDDYLHFFDVTPHSEKPDEDDCKCYCVWWCAEEQTDEVFEKHLATKEKRRSYARAKIIENKLKGYLAYAAGKAVGWCNANTKSECYNCFCWKSFMGEIKKEDCASKIKSVVCFAVAPEARGKGIATKLLDRVCEDAKNEGFLAVEGYPNETFLNAAQDFMGPLALYKNAGFNAAYTINGKTVMKKAL